MRLTHYELLGTDVEIHVVFSLCGGTGSGTFINLAYTLRHLLPQCKVTGYAVTPEVFKAMAQSGMELVEPNAFGAIMDLDYLMAMDMSSTPFNLEYLQEADDYPITSRPFNTVVFVDNQNANSDTYAKVEDLAQLISLALVTASGELSTGASSVGDNLEKHISDGGMDIINKKAWAGGIGACEITYKGEELGKLYSYKAAKHLIERFQNSCEDVDSIANAWIDSADVNIRENNGNDNVINFIHPKQLSYELSIINDKDNPKPEIEVYTKSVAPDPEKLKNKTDELWRRVNKALNELVVKQVNKECGISTTIKVLDSIQAQVNLFLGEMNKEKDEFIAKRPYHESEVNIAIEDVKSCFNTWRKKHLQEKCDDLIDAVRNLAILDLEIARRTSAISFYTTLTTGIQDQLTRVNNLNVSLIALYNKLIDYSGKITNGIGSQGQTFQIDLAQKSKDQVNVDPKDILIADFVKAMKSDVGILALSELDSQSLENKVLSYTNSLRVAKKWCQTSIDEIIDGMDEATFDKLIKDAISKSLPLFRADACGYQPIVNPCDAYYIGVPKKEVSRLCKDDKFVTYIDGTPNVSYINIGGKNRIIIYRQFGVVPVYELLNIKRWENVYSNPRFGNRCYHIDKNLETRMLREEFSVFPKVVTDDDILELWVKGFIFGLLKNENDKYYMQSQSEGDSLDDYWVELGAYRDDAFNAFRGHKSIVRKEFNNYFDNKEVVEGTEAMKVLLADAKLHYYDKYSQIKLTKQQLKNTKGFESIADLVRKELDFIKNL